jgi:hypothetical protein
MSVVDLDNEEWQRVLNIIAAAPWNMANPLLMKIGEQLRQQQQGNSGEVPENRAQVERVNRDN